MRRHSKKIELCADRKRMEEKAEIALAGRENVNDGEPTMTEEDRASLYMKEK